MLFGISVTMLAGLPPTDVIGPLPFHINTSGLCPLIRMLFGSLLESVLPK